MDILIVITCLKPHGAEYSCLRHIKEYKIKYNVNFTLLSIIGGELENEFKKLGIPIFRLNEKITFKNLKNLIKNIFFKKYDLIHTWMYHANILGMIISIFTKIPVITSIRQAFPNYNSLKRKTILYAFIDSFLSRIIAKKIVFNSKASINDHNKRLLYCKKKSVYIPNKPYTIKFKKKFLNKSNEKNNKLYFLSLARDDKSKNLTYMIELFNALKNKKYELILDIYGDNIDNSMCKKFYENLNPINKIRFFPKISNLESILFKYDFYISTSLWEGYPNSLITAASSGCIPIATNAGDSWDLLGNNLFKLRKNVKYDLKIIHQAIIFNEKNSRENRSINSIDFLRKGFINSLNFSDLYFNK